MLTRVSTYLSASIGRRLAFGMTATLLFGLAVATVLSMRDEQKAIRDILEVKGRTTLNITNRRLSTAFDPANLQAFSEEFEPVLADSDFAYAFLFNDKGVLIALNDPGVTPGPYGPLPPVRELTRRNVVYRVGNYLEILAPVTVNGQRVAGLGLGISLHLVDRQMGRLRYRLLFFIALLIGSALAFISWWSRRMVAPLSQLTETAERFTAGDFNARVAVVGVDEVATLATSFNKLAQSLQQTLQEKDRVLAETRRLYRNLKVARARLGRAERLSAVGMLAAGVSHELNNPLGIILATAGNLRETLHDRPEVAEDVEIIANETQRCRRIIQGLLNFAATGESRPEEVDLNELLRETFALAVRDERAAGLQVAWALDPRLPMVTADPRQLQQVFLNLLLNAADAMGGSGTVTIRTADSIHGGRRRALIEFADHGCGIGAEDLEHIFDPFYTTKKGGSGYGLGLAVSYGLITGHGGEITVRSEPGHGSAFTITLPRHPAPIQADLASQTV